MNKQDDKQERVTPKLRFPEFQTTLGWDKHILNDYSEIVRGGSPRPIDNYLTKNINGLNWLKIGDVDKDAKYVTKTEERVISEALSKTREVSRGDFILSNSMSFGRPYILQIDTCIHDGWIAITNIDERLDKNYLYYLILTSSCQNYFLKNAAGSSVLNLNAEIIKSLPITLPKIEEQQKIADCLSSIDELIELQEQKLAALKQHKKGLMQQLFPSHNDLQASKQAIVYPKLRFPQFKDCKGWEIVELEELFDLTIQNEKANSFDKDKIITVKLHTLGVVKNERTDTLTGGANYFHRKAGDFIFSKIDFLNGAFGIVPNELDGFCSSSDIPSFSFKPESNANFFMYWLKANYLDFKIERAGTSNTLKRISPKALFAMHLPIPLPEEQQAIADCLSSLDKLISEENEQIGRLKDHKKGLMQQLFPKIQ